MRIGSYKFSPTLVPTIVMIVLVVLFVSLGNWQTDRAAFKQGKKDKRAANRQLPAMRINSDKIKLGQILGRKTLTPGKFDIQHTAVLANKRYKRSPGFLVVTPFAIEGTDLHVLVLRGWISHDIRKGFTVIPPLPKTNGEKFVLQGMIDNVPGIGIKAGQPDESFRKQWPKIITYVDIKWYSKKLGKKFLPYVVKQTFANGPKLIADWKEFDSFRQLMPPEKHMGYAFQWFALAFVLVLLYFMLNIHKIRSEKENGDS